MQIPEDPGHRDIRDALLQLNQRFDELDQKVERLGDKFDGTDATSEIRKRSNPKVERLDYRFGIDPKTTERMVRLAITVTITTAALLALSSLGPAVTAIITALTQGSPSGY